MKTYIYFFLVVLISGCATLGARESLVTLPSGEEYRILCQSDGKLDYTAGGVQISVDNRGRPGILEQMFGALVLSLPGESHGVRLGESHGVRLGESHGVRKSRGQACIVAKCGR